MDSAQAVPGVWRGRTLVVCKQSKVGTDLWPDQSEWCQPG